MNLLWPTFSLFAMVLAAPTPTFAEDYTGYPALPEIQKERIVRSLYEHHLLGLPEQKPIFRDLLAKQGYSTGEAGFWTIRVIDFAEKQGWKDLAPLISKIYERPTDVRVFERASRYLRTQGGNPVSTNLIAAADALEAAGEYLSTVSDDQLSGARERLLQEPDKEAVLVYALKAAVLSGAGKGGTHRGRGAAVDILKGLDRKTVARRLLHLRQDGPDYLRQDPGRVANDLGISLEDR